MKIERIVRGDGKLEKGDYDYYKVEYLCLRIFLDGGFVIIFDLPKYNILVNENRNGQLSVPYHKESSHDKSYKWRYKTNET